MLSPTPIALTRFSCYNRCNHNRVTPMSLIKTYLYEVTERPTEDDLAEYELYCLYLDMGERLKNLPESLEYFREVFE